jgi:hypothetical protein
MSAANLVAAVRGGDASIGASDPLTPPRFARVALSLRERG